MKVPPMVPSAESRTLEAMGPGALTEMPTKVEKAIEQAHRDGYTAGFAAALAMLKAMSDDHVAEVMRHEAQERPYEAAIVYHTDVARILHAAASALAESAEKDHT